MPTKMQPAFLMCAGMSERWHGEGPKHLVQFGWETLLHRTERMVSDCGYTGWTVTVHPELINEASHVVQPGAYRWLCESILSTGPYWPERVIILLGDVVWTRKSLQAVLSCSAPWMFFGTEFELYALVFEDKTRVVKALETVIALAEKKRCPGKLWNLWRFMNGLPIADHKLEELHHSYFTPKNLFFIRDETHDIDTVEQYETMRRKMDHDYSLSHSAA